MMLYYQIFPSSTILLTHPSFRLGIDVLNQLMNVAGASSDRTVALKLRTMAAYESYEVQQQMGAHNRTLIKHNPFIKKNARLPMDVFVAQYRQSARIWEQLAKTQDSKTLYDLIREHPLTVQIDFVTRALSTYGYEISGLPVYDGKKAQMVAHLHLQHVYAYLFSGPLWEPIQQESARVIALQRLIESSKMVSGYFSELSRLTTEKSPYQAFQFLFFAADLRKRSLQIMDFRHASPIHILSPDDNENESQEESIQVTAILSNTFTVPEEISIRKSEKTIIKQEEQERDAFLKDIYERAIQLFAQHEAFYLDYSVDVSAKFMVDMVDAHLWLSRHGLTVDHQDENYQKARKFAENARKLVREYHAKDIFLHAYRPVDSHLLDFIYKPSEPIKTKVGGIGAS